MYRSYRAYIPCSYQPGISLTLHTGLDSCGPTDRGVVAFSAKPPRGAWGGGVEGVGGRLRLSPHLGFASWRSLKYFAVSRH